MSEVLSSLGGLFKGGNLGTTLSGGALGLGEIGNLLAGRQASQQASALKKQEDAFTSLTPAQLTQKVQSAEAPINQGLEQSINNSVQGNLASQGLAQAPGIQASETAQALGPIEQANYNTALQQVMQQYNLPIEYAAAIKQFLPGVQNMTPALKLFLEQLAKQKGGSSAGSNYPIQMNPSGPPSYPGGTPPIAPTYGSGIASGIDLNNLDMSQLAPLTAPGQ